jgi:hypothetical protein
MVGWWLCCWFVFLPSLPRNLASDTAPGLQQPRQKKKNGTRILHLLAPLARKNPENLEKFRKSAPGASGSSGISENGHGSSRPRFGLRGGESELLLERLAEIANVAKTSSSPNII